MQRPQHLYYFPQWMDGNGLLCSVPDEGQASSDEEAPFSEVCIKYEKYITCDDCLRRFTSKKSYNSHVQECSEDFYDDGPARNHGQKNGNHMTNGHSPVNEPIKTKPRSSGPRKQKLPNGLRGRSKSMPTPYGSNTELNLILEIKQETLDTISGNGTVLPKSGKAIKENGRAPPPAKIKLENGRSTSIDELMLLESNALTTSDSYECKVCHKVYFTKYGFKLHLRTHTGNKGYTCDICEKSFSQSGHLKDHRRIHTGEKPFSCELCGKKFAQNQNLKHHLRMHSGVRPYKCKACDKGFFTKCELSSHERVHSGDKPFNCQVCAKSFSQLSGLKSHLKSHADEGPLACPCCEQMFENQATLLNHIRCHESGGPFNCDVCGASFMKKGSLLHHAKFHVTNGTKA